MANLMHKVVGNLTSLINIKSVQHYFNFSFNMAYIFFIFPSTPFPI